jgi:hypothetical protein
LFYGLGGGGIAFQNSFILLPSNLPISSGVGGVPLVMALMIAVQSVIPAAVQAF